LLVLPASKASNFKERGGSSIFSKPGLDSGKATVH